MPIPGSVFFYVYMNVYVDESGDLGWEFTHPFRQGGSSRYLTIAFLLVPKTLSHLPKRIVRKLYTKRKKSTKNELKGANLNSAEEAYFAKEVIRLLNKHPDIEILAITVNKKNVQQHIRDDPNKLYNYMIGLVLPEKIKFRPTVTFIPDKRSIKVESGNSLVDYIQIKLWFELNASTTIHNQPEESRKTLNLQFIDFISHIIWGKFEDNEYSAYNILRSKVKVIPLFF